MKHNLKGLFSQEVFTRGELDLAHSFLKSKDDFLSDEIILEELTYEPEDLAEALIKNKVGTFIVVDSSASLMHLIHCLSQSGYKIEGTAKVGSRLYENKVEGLKFTRAI